jgi:hypothetical protein
LSQRTGLFVWENHRQQSNRHAFAFRKHGGVALMGSWSQFAQPPSDIKPKLGGLRWSLSGVDRQRPGGKASQCIRLSRIDCQQLGCLAVGFVSNQNIPFADVGPSLLWPVASSDWLALSSLYYYLSRSSPFPLSRQ